MQVYPHVTNFEMSVSLYVSLYVRVCVCARACMRACEVVESGMNGLIEAEDVVLQLRFRLHLLREYIL